MTTLCIASGNAHKVKEISEILGGGLLCLGLKEFSGAPVPVEDAETFAGNAKIKVLSLASWLAANAAVLKAKAPTGAPVFVLADDSGLEVDALGGAPGVHSARFAGGEAAARVNSPDSANNAKLLQLLEKTPLQLRTARFHCVLALVPPAPATDRIIMFDGVCEGRVGGRPSGGGGFGYDPLFVPEGFSKSFAELGEEEKNKLSHRARALHKLREFLGKGNY